VGTRTRGDGIVSLCMLLSLRLIEISRQVTQEATFNVFVTLSPEMTLSELRSDPFVTPPSSPEKSYFDFSWNWDNGDTALDILELKQFAIVNPRIFSIVNPPTYDDQILKNIMEIFRHCSELSLQWETLDLHLKSEGISSFNFARPLLFAANMSSLFSRLIIRADATIEGQAPSQSEFLLSGATLNRRLECLEIRSNSTGGQMSAGDFWGLTSLLQTTTTLKELSMINMTNFDQSSLCQGLSANKTLEKVALSLIICDVPDECIAMVLNALEGNHNLHTLELYSSSQFGPLSSNAIKALLAGSSSLSWLTLHGFEYFPFDDRGKLDSNLLLQGLKENRSLKKLRLADALDEADDLFSSFFDILSHCPTLQMLHLWEPHITGKDLESVAKMKRLNHPIILGLASSVLESHTLTLVDVLSCHPELRLEYKGFNGQTEYTGLKDERNFLYICDLNWYGKYLKERPEFPLSLWSVILEKANSRPNVVYETLKGPAFTERQPYHR
jgi:hypothetical protein